MNRFLTVCLILLVPAVCSAQWIVNGFETAAADSFFQHPPVNSGLGTGSGSAVLTDHTTAPAPYHGSAALKVDWTVHSTESWGGFVQMMHLVPPEDSTYLDFSSATELNLWYYNITPSSQTGLVNMRFKIHESGGSANYWADGNDHEDWYFEAAGVYDAAPGWVRLVVPLVDNGGGSPNSQGLTLPGWSGRTNNGTLDLDRVVGYSIEWTTPGIPSNGTASGTVLWDKLQMKGARYTPISTFDSIGVNTTYFSKDLMSWSAGNTGNLTFTDMTSDPIEGYSSLKVNWRVHNTESWGGYVNFSHVLPAGTYYPDMSANTDLLLLYKNASASTLVGGVTMRLFLYDFSDGVEERWAHALAINLDSVSADWTLLRIPLTALEGDEYVLTSDGFKIPGWESVKGNSTLNLDKIGGFRLEFTSPGPSGSIGEGEIWFDLLIPTGYRELDTTGPTQVTNVAGTPGTFVNLVTWSDVAGEVGEKYDVFYSENPITDVAAPGIEVVKLSVPENTQVVEHVLRAPATNQSVTYYYAVRATDKVGNVGALGQGSSAVTNTAKGVPVISLTPPSPFVADGNLAEWSGIAPITIRLSEGTGFKAPNTKIDNDADLAVQAYLAVDQQYLYIAFDIEDDVVQVDTNDSQTWMQDCPDLFIGLYDFHGVPHKSFLRGAAPDHQFRFAENRIIEDKLTSFDLRPGADYVWHRKFPTGYTIEARLSWASIAAAGGDSLFVPKEGMRIPIDFSINDNDNPVTRREGILTYSPNNEDKSYLEPSRWTHTWIGTEWYVVSVGGENQVPLVYELHQNYPNPFNPSTRISYSLEHDGFVTLRVFDLIGREVARLVNEHQVAGTYTVTFDAASVGRLGTGAYFYHLESGPFRSVRKMLLVK